MRAKYVIIGAGPTGLGAAHRLQELGENDFLVLERDRIPGGLAASFRDKAGFTWDFGGHVLFSHYKYFDSLVDSLMGSDFLSHERVSFVRCAGTWVPYPFQNNIRHLPPEIRWRCVEGLLPGRRPKATPKNFHQWIETVFGAGIAETFLWPYNHKVWATPPELMAFDWIGERVAVTDLEMVLKNIVLERDDVAWGPNNTFKFPVHGGTGEIFARLARTVEDRIRYDEFVTTITPADKCVTCASGEHIYYDTLLNTGPLDLLAGQWLQDPELAEAAKGLTHNSVHVAGVGVEGMHPDAAGDPRCWMYFPESDCPFYRVTNFHNYSPQNVAEPGRQRALMCETSYSAHKPESLDELLDASVQGLSNVTLLEPEGKVASRFEITREYAYPVPCLTRDKALAAIQPKLEAMDIWSRGRFGGWKYEVGNMDHSVMQGVEWAGRMVAGKPETTYTY